MLCCFENALVAGHAVCFGVQAMKEHVFYMLPVVGFARQNFFAAAVASVPHPSFHLLQNGQIVVFSHGLYLFSVSRTNCL